MSKKTCADCIHCQMCRWIDDMVKNSTCDFFEEWGCRPHGMWKIDGTDYADGKVTAIYISHEFHGLDYAKFVPERPHGEWEALGFQQGYAFCRCSNCHKTMRLYRDSKNEFCCIADIRKKVVSCMYCGADMRRKSGEQNDG